MQRLVQIKKNTHGLHQHTATIFEIHDVQGAVSDQDAVAGAKAGLHVRLQEAVENPD